MGKQYQWLGYWGLNQDQAVEKTLKVLFPHIETGYQLQILNKSKNISGKIAYFGETLLDTKLGNITVISFAASGIKNASDAWIKIDKDNLILGRDSFGRVPSYWTQINQGIWFSSHCQLLSPILSSQRVNLTALYNYTCFSYVPTPLTPIEGIFSINAGEEIRFFYGNNQVSYSKKIIHQWQSLPKTVKEEKQAIPQLQRLLKQSVENQLEGITNEPVGICLSGGLDSSIIAALLVKLGVKVRGYTLEFDKDKFSEYPYAEIVAKHLNIPLVKVKITPKKIKNNLIKTVQGLDLPFGDSVTIPLSLLYQTACQDTEIIFNGENGDQLFAGWTNKPMIASNIYQVQHPEFKKDFSDQYLQTFHRLYGYEKRIFTANVYQKLSLNQPKKAIISALEKEFSTCLLDRLRRATLMLKGAQNIQPRATYLSNENGLWVRSPFCDIKLTQWTFQTSENLFLKQSCEKYILKKAVESWLPDEIVWRKKRGMGVPLTSWCLTSLWLTLGDWLNPSILKAEGRIIENFPLQLILGQISGHLRGRRIGEILWLLLMWEVWRVKVLGEDTAKVPLLNPFYIPPSVWKKYANIRVNYLGNYE
ncbi:MAG: asparagine synthetase B family protein [Crocosphaera sp.]|nr:asparagine synthetase B family protein [Crocosphaera sp.]